MSFNKLIVVGNLTRDAELRYTAQGTPVCTVNVLCDRAARSIAGSPSTRILKQGLRPGADARGVGRQQEAPRLGAHLRQRQPDRLPLDLEHGDAGLRQLFYLDIR